jgi:murein DD-endopeptidase MepM/ murein hydrolase activator NlpD
MAAAGWIGLGDLVYQREWRARQTEALRTEAANAELRAWAARLRQRLGRTMRELADAEARIAARESAARTMRADLAAAEQQLQRLQTASAPVVAPVPGVRAQATQMAQQQAGQMVRLQDALVAAERRQQTAAAQRAAMASRLAAAEADLERSKDEAGRLKLAFDRLTAKLGRLGQQPAALPAGARTAAAPGVLGKVERALASAGIDARRIFASFGIRRGVGGPFIPARDAPSLARMTAEQAAVRTMLKTLPVDAPLLHYRETSSYGARVDPINERGGFHPGVDLAAPYDSPVYATAPGLVTFAGWESGYGKIVKIDHGHGLSTGYAHLHRYTVVVGEKVAAGTVIGYIGTTGRSTGPHLHYEVRLHGETVNPAAFLALGHEIAPTASPILPVAAR